MNEKMKCFNVHGHTYLAELEFKFEGSQEIGYAIDFKEIKRIGCQWIDDFLDHGSILNPDDTHYRNLCKKLKSKVWIMSLNGEKYCNPTVENIAKEILLAMDELFEEKIPGLYINKVTLHETPNCYTICTRESVNEVERRNFSLKNAMQLIEYSKKKGAVEYDDRK